MNKQEKLKNEAPMKLYSKFPIRWDKKVFIILIIIGIFVYGNSLFNGFVGDDTEQIYNLSLVKNFFDLPKVFFYHHTVLNSESSILNAYYKPLMLFYLYSIRQIFGLNPFFYHFPQLFLFITNSFLAYTLFTYFFKKNIALVLAVLFLVHPINQETAVYISNIQDVLYFFFGMSAILLVLKKHHGIKQYVAMGLLLLLSLFSKESGILFMVIIIFYIYLYKKEEFKKIVFITSIIFSLYAVTRFFSKTTNAFWIEPPPMASLPLQNRLKHIPLIFLYYIKTFFYPLTLSFNQQWIIKSFNFQTFLYPLTVMLGIFTFLIIFIIKLYKKNIPEKKTTVFFSLWFFLGIIPHMQILPLDTTVANRWFYFSSVGIIGVFGIFISLILEKFHRKSGIIFMFFITVLLLLSFITVLRNTKFQNAFVLYSTDHMISKSPLLENNLGDEYFKKGDLKSAEKHFRNALYLNPDLWIAINNLGTVYEKKENFSLAYSYYISAQKKADRLPISENIARILLLSGKKEEAEKYTKKEIKKYPLSSRLWLTLALAYYEQEKYNDALNCANRSFELSPSPQILSVIQAIHERNQ